VKTRDLLDLLVLGAIWGASFLFMRIAAPEFGAIPLITARVGIGAALLILVLARRSGLSQLRPNAVRLTVLGALNSAIPFSLFAYAVIFVTAGFASVLNSTAPLFGALVAFIWLRDRPQPVRVAGLIVGFAGVLVLVWGRASVSSGGGGTAVLAGLAASVLYGISANYAKKRMSDIDSLVIATGSLIAATAMLLPLAVVYWPVTAPSRTSWISAVLLGVFCTGIAYILYFRLLSRIGPAKALAVTYLIPAFGVLWGHLFLGEPVSTSMIAACGIILLGTTLATGVLSNWRERGGTVPRARAYRDQRG
jgi:drug/metabolite transporter (DMT)-like permease